MIADWRNASQKQHVFIRSLVTRTCLKTNSPYVLLTHSISLKHGGSRMQIIIIILFVLIFWTILSHLLHLFLHLYLFFLLLEHIKLKTANKLPEETKFYLRENSLNTVGYLLEIVLNEEMISICIFKHMHLIHWLS